MSTLTELRNEHDEGLKEMSFLEHLGELRKVLIQSLIVVATVIVTCWFFSRWLLDFLIKDLPVQSLYFNSPIEAFAVRMKVSAILGLMIAFPFVLVKFWSFVSPGLFSHERKRIYPLVIVSSALFYAGVLFCYFVLIPVVLKFLLSFGTPYVSPLLSVSAYFYFVARLCFSFGIVFQIPIVVFVLSLLGLVTPGMLLRQWRYGVLVIFVVSAILTPPDVASQLMMAVPVLVLYIGSVLVAFAVVKKRKKSGEGGPGVSP